MLEEAISYIKQQKKAYKKWKNAGYSFKSNEFLSQMIKDEKYIPVITLVLYLGKEIWDGAKTLYEILEIDEELKPFVTNFKLNIFDYHDFKEFSQFKTENRFLFELLSSSNDENRTEKIIEKYLNDYSLDEESAKTIFGILDINLDIDKYKNKQWKEFDITCVKPGMIIWKEEDKKEDRKEGRNYLKKV